MEYWSGTALENCASLLETSNNSNNIKIYKINSNCDNNSDNDSDINSDEQSKLKRLHRQ